MMQNLCADMPCFCRPSHICAVNFALGNVPMSDPKLKEVRVATRADTTM